MKNRVQDDGSESEISGDRHDTQYTMGVVFQRWGEQEQEEKAAVSGLGSETKTAGKDRGKNRTIHTPRMDGR